VERTRACRVEWSGAQVEPLRGGPKRSFFLSVDSEHPFFLRPLVKRWGVCAPETGILQKGISPGELYGHFHCRGASVDRG
jgi:hypothetical protein